MMHGALNNKQKIYLSITIAVFSLLITSTIAEGFVKGTVGLKRTDDDVDNLVCGDRLCSEIDETSSKIIAKNQHTPLGQYNLGVLLEDIMCKDGLEFVLKISNMYPACVTQKTKEKLILRGWAANESIIDEILSNPTLPDATEKQNFGINITPDTQDDKRFLNFEGFGWQRHHTVLITITNDQGFYTQLKSKTTDRGDLYMPWPVSDLAQAGMYHIVANDGFHKFEIDIPITAP